MASQLDGAPVDAPTIDGPDAGEPPDADLRPDACVGPVVFGDFRVPALFIPDNNLTGVFSRIEVDAPCVTVQTVDIRIGISHQFRGDVGITLRAPDGELVTVLPPTSGDSRVNINEVFTVDIAVGDGASGEWELNVFDNLVQFTGTLDRWSIGINDTAP